MKLKFDVRTEDIEAGRPTEDACPVALAGNRALAEAGLGRYRVTFMPYAAYERGGDGLAVVEPGDPDREVCRLPLAECPEEADRFGEYFDAWYGSRHCGLGRPSPLAFEVELPLEGVGAGEGVAP